ncbi:MAG: SH3 domain-containing protein [Gemmatales bacterium]
MSILVACCLTVFVKEAAWIAPEENHPSAWIAVLRDYERQWGRDAWSYQELSEARAGVFDPYFAVKASSGWLYQLSLLYFSYYPVLFAAVSILCGWIAWRYYRRNQWGSVLMVNLLWFLLLWTALLPVQPTSAPAAVIKLQGVPLREGNGLTYQETRRGSTRLTLAAGVEADLLAEAQNGWVKIELADGTAGWVPTDAVYLVR